MLTIQKLNIVIFKQKFKISAMKLCKTTIMHMKLTRSWVSVRMVMKFC